MTYGVGKEIWSFLENKTLLTTAHGVQSKYYSAHREYVSKLLNSSDLSNEEFRHVEDWDDALIALS